ncbi:MAG: anthranilate phosphoribosyltransferase [Planctomycetaceae bacterium]
MSTDLTNAIRTTVAGASLTAPQMTSAMGAIMDGTASEIEIAAFLTALAAKGETADEIAGAAAAMRQRVTVVPATTGGLLDTCGTGGDRLNTFNISTATAIVVAACGVPVAKHGNRSATSSSGSAEVLQTLGVNIELPPDRVAACIDEIGIGFCYARLLHSAMKHVAPVRASLGFRTIFNLLGPLTNPAGARFQLLGTTSVATAEKLARAVSKLGTERTIVVCGNDQLDEVALWGTTTAFVVEGPNLRRLEWTAADLGLPECDVATLRVDSPQASADRITGLLSGEPGPSLDIVLANAGMALWCVGQAPAPLDGVLRAGECVRSGACTDKLRRLVEWTNAG